MCKWLILSVKLRMAILGKAPGIAIYYYGENLMHTFAVKQLFSAVKIQ